MLLKDEAGLPPQPRLLRAGGQAGEGFAQGRHLVQAGPVVITRGLRKSYDRKTEILKGIDLTIRRGERVAIARALVRRPVLLIADEPAASLDPVSGQDVMALFARLCADHGITLLFSSHDMAHARAYADRIVALKAGRVLFDKPAATTTDADLTEVFRVDAR